MLTFIVAPDLNDANVHAVRLGLLPAHWRYAQAWYAFAGVREATVHVCPRFVTTGTHLKRRDHAHLMRYLDRTYEVHLLTVCESETST